jgi:hypothetical protein
MFGNMMSPRNLASAVVTLAICVPVGGFVFGFVHCTGCEGIWGRVFIGVVFAVLTTFTLGFPPKNEGGVGEPYNVWPYIILLALMTLGFLSAFTRLRNRSESRKEAEPGAGANAAERSDSDVTG